MKVEILDFVEGAKSARGAAVIIDVFRAFSVACYAFAAGAEEIIAVGSVDAALSFRSGDAETVLVGERGGRKLEGFDIGNSPTELQNADLKGRRIIQTTHAGTQGLVAALGAEMIFTGAFVNARATADRIRLVSPERVSLVRMGWEGRERTDEDDLCAEYLQALLLGIEFDTSEVREKLRASPCSERFFDPNKPWSPPSDFELCLDIDRFDFAVQVARKLEVGAVLKRMER